MSETLTCIAWSLCTWRKEDSSKRCEETRIVVIDEYLIVGTRYLKGVDCVSYKVTRRNDAQDAHEAAVQKTEEMESRGYDLFILPTVWQADKTREWLDFMCLHPRNAEYGLMKFVTAGLASGTPLGVAA